MLYERVLGLDEKGSPQHATALLAEVERAAEAAGGWPEIGCVAVGLGPGSFTGIRVGVATARGVAASRGIPARGVCTLDALGRAIAERRPPGGALAAIDARRGELFVARYGDAGERLDEPAVVAPGELPGLLEELEPPPLAAGSGAVRFRQELASIGIEVPADDDPVHRVSGRQICALAENEGAAAEAGELRPIYLRPPDAERWRERNTVETND